MSVKMKKHRIKYGKPARKAWAVFSREPGGTAEAFADKGTAKRFVKRLKKSHPGAHYDVRSLVVPTDIVFEKR
jgi:hypothetical protein